MLIGEYEHSLDPKGRIIVPQKMRDALGDQFVITKGLDDCLFVYPMNEWAKFEERINGMPLTQAKGLQRFFFSRACEALPDKQGRVLIPQELRDYAGLTKDVVIIGASVRAEIWDKARWERENQEMSSQEAQLLLEKLGF